jgi:hypothetical protein
MRAGSTLELSVLHTNRDKVLFASEDLSYLLKDTYDPAFRKYDSSH